MTRSLAKGSVAAATFLLLVGCDGKPTQMPLAPTPVASAPLPPAATAGNITLVSLTHPAGSTLFVDDCGPSWTGIAGSHLCNLEWRAAFDVVLHEDLSDAIVTVSFYNGSERCGDIYVSAQSFAANRERPVSTSSPLYFTYEPEGYDNLTVIQRCSLPTTTTRFVVQLWGHRVPQAPLLRREFDYLYTFVGR